MTDLLATLRDIPRLRLAQLPTVLEPMPRLAASLGVASLHVKRDDCTGLGLGGNKIRKLEFNLAAARDAGADVIVCGGVVQSNTARQVAAACARLRLECHLGIMHLASHKVAGVREAIEAQDASLWFLSGYSPELNPIEPGFSKLKAQIRKAAPRTREALWQRTGSIIQDFTPAECANFLANAGYGRSA